VYKALVHACHDLTIKAGHILEPDQNDEALSLSLLKEKFTLSCKPLIINNNNRVLIHPPHQAGMYDHGQMIHQTVSSLQAWFRQS
jgi:hypothetical protein